MVIKYLFLITFIYKSYEVRLPTENCGNGKFYNYFLLDCYDYNQSKYQISILNKIICKDKQFYGINNDNIIDCLDCPSGTNSTPDGYYCAKNIISGDNCSFDDYYDNFYGIKNNITCPNKTTNRMLSNFKEDINTIYLRRITINYTYHFFEDGKNYKQEIQNTDVFDSTNNPQHLANLCVLKMYNKNEPECINFTGYDNTNIPQIYFNPNNYENDIFNKTLTNNYSYNTKYDSVTKSNFTFYLRKFYLNGTIVTANDEILTNQFVFCSQKSDDEINYRRFGVVIDNHCEIDLERFKDQETFFYEIYVNDASDNSTTTNLIQVPILIDNINNENTKKSFSQTGIKLNNESNREDWILVKRFFLFENVINSNYVTFAKYIKFRFNMTRSGTNAQVNIPILELFYSTKQIVDSSNVNDNEKTNFAYVSFQSEYQTGMKHFMKVMLGLLIAACVIVFIIVIYKVWVWIKLNPKNLSPDTWFIDLLITLIFTLCRFFGIFMFWFTLIISAYWYFFYKLQSRIYLLIPPLRFYSKYYEKFDIVFGLGCSTYFLYMIYRIFRQVSFDIFFIDWEQEKEIFKNANTSDDIAIASKYRRYRGAWRMLHVANQFNALQSKRVISLYFSFCWLILLYYKCKWSYREIQVPSTKYHEHSPVNFIIRHFLASIIVIGSGAIQYIIVRALQLWIPLKKQEFLDLCSVSNISVFLLDEKLHGYYIHGQAPFGKADANFDELLRFLDEERKGKVRSRGFSQGEEDTQSYELYITNRMRTIYDGLYYIQNEAFYSQNQNQHDIQKVINERNLGIIYKYIPDLAQKEKLDYYDNYMNNQLKNIIEHASSKPELFIKEKNMIERILNVPPNNFEMEKNDVSLILYKDPNLSFDDVLFSGMEWEWFVMDVYLFQFWMRILDDTEIAIFLTYLIDYALAFIRKFFGEKNVAKKAVIDDRFFS